MADPRIPLKNRYLAGVLAYLVPGAGHLYQGRMFKGVLYLVCILGAYLFGLSLSQWKAVHWRWEAREKNIAFFAQAGVGMFAIPALVQARRYANQPDVRDGIEQPLSAEFRGKLKRPDGAAQPIVGRVELKSEVGDFGPEIRGRFSGEVILEDGGSEPLELTLSRPDEIGPKIGAGAERLLKCNVIDEERAIDEFRFSRIEGTIQRRFADHFAVPLQDKDLGELSDDLGKFYELAKIFTWIAGLLNVLAVWDAFEGPAYGYGNEEESTDEKSGDDSENAVAGGAHASQSDKVAEPAGKAASAEEPAA